MRKDCLSRTPDAPWSPEKLERCREMYEGGRLPVSIIATAMQTTVRRIHLLAEGQGWKKRATRTISRPGKKEIDWARVRKEYESSSVPAKFIARRLGISQVTLTKKARADGWKMRSGAGQYQPGKRAPEVEQAVTALRKTGVCVFQEKDGLYRYGTILLTEEALMQKAARYA